MSAPDPSHSRGLVATPEPLSGPVTYHVPTIRDGAEMWRLARDSQALDLNSPYMYLLGASHFAETSIVARAGDSTVGFGFGYRRPDSPDTLFVWQIAVAPPWRGCGIAQAMLTELTNRLRPAGCRFLEATVTPDNRPSAALFTGFARALGLPLDNRTVLFSDRDFPAGTPHQPEVLYRIGPFPA